METKSLDVMVGKKAQSDVAKDKIGKSETKVPKEEGVGGRALVRRWVECPCNGCITWIVYDTNRYHAYECSNCGCVMVF